MAQVILYAVLGVLGLVGLWQLVVWMCEIQDKNRKYRAADLCARHRSKPLLVVGGPWGAKAARRWLGKPAHGGGDVCLDVDRRAINGHPGAVLASATHIPFRDNAFGAAFASHLLEHLPTVEAARQALEEMYRVAGDVFITCPSRQSIAGWVIPEHHLWVWQKEGTTYLRQRGGVGELQLCPALEARPAAGGDASSLEVEIERLAREFFGVAGAKPARFARWVAETAAACREVEFLIIHNPGGWGNTRLERCLDWERSIVFGVTDTLDHLGRSWSLVQYFRSGDSFWSHMRDVGKEARFFWRGRSVQARAVAAALRLIRRHFPRLNVILVGASQGAAFSNAVMRELGDVERVYSLELGIFFPHMHRRVVTQHTLAIDSNGLMPDPMAHRDLWAGTKAYAGAFVRWFRYRTQGQPRRFTDCINVPGHEYAWEYPAVSSQIVSFLSREFARAPQSGGC